MREITVGPRIPDSQRRVWFHTPLFFENIDKREQGNIMLARIECQRRLHRLPEEVRKTALGVSVGTERTDARVQHNED